MQHPTAIGIKIRSTEDAHILFHAVALDVLPMITRRLDPQERQELKPGNCYIWEERGSDAEATGMGIERWTDGKHWGPSRVRDDFLFYHQRGNAELDEAGGPKEGRMKYGKRRRSQPPPGRVAIPRASPPLNGLPISEGDRLVKQTYSVLTKKASDPEHKHRRKWHLTAYFTTNLLDSLKTVRDIPELANIDPPAGLYMTARVGKKRDNEYAPSTSSIYRSTAMPTDQASEHTTPRSLATLEPSTHPTPIYQSPPPLPARHPDLKSQLPSVMTPSVSWPAPGPPGQLPHISTILPGGEGPSSATAASSYSLFLQHSVGIPRPGDMVSPHSGGPLRDYFSPSPHPSPAASTNSMPCAPATPPYEPQELPPLGYGPSPTQQPHGFAASKFPDYRLPPLDFTPAGRLPARGAEDERALWALTYNFNR